MTDCSYSPLTSERTKIVELCCLCTFCSTARIGFNLKILSRQLNLSISLAACPVGFYRLESRQGKTLVSNAWSHASVVPAVQTMLLTPLRKIRKLSHQVSDCSA